VLRMLQCLKGSAVSYSNPMHHETPAPTRAPIVPSLVSGAAYARVERERDPWPFPVTLPAPGHAPEPKPVRPPAPNPATMPDAPF